jgi:hypothetical protein
MSCFWKPVADDAILATSFLPCSHSSTVWHGTDVSLVRQAEALPWLALGLQAAGDSRLHICLPDAARLHGIVETQDLRNVPTIVMNARALLVGLPGATGSASARQPCSLDLQRQQTLVELLLQKGVSPWLVDHADAAERSERKLLMGATPHRKAEPEIYFGGDPKPYGWDDHASVRLGPAEASVGKGSSRVIGAERGSRQAQCLNLVPKTSRCYPETAMRGRR